MIIRRCVTGIGGSDIVVLGAVFLFTTQVEFTHKCHLYYYNTNLYRPCKRQILLLSVLMAYIRVVTIYFPDDSHY